MTPVVGDAVDIPPGIAIRADRDIKARSCMIASAACRPDSVAIGMPAPGCTPPPARYRPGITVRAPGRRKVAVSPCGLIP